MMSPVRQNDVFGQLGRMNTEPTNVSVFIATLIASSVLTNFFRDQAPLHTSESQTKQCFLHLSSLYSEACSQVRLLYIKWKPLSTVDYCSIVIVLMLSITLHIVSHFHYIQANDPVVVETNSYTSAIGSIRPVTLSFRPQTVPIYLWCRFLFGKYTLSIENITWRSRYV